MAENRFKYENGKWYIWQSPPNDLATSDLDVGNLPAQWVETDEKDISEWTGGKEFIQSQKKYDEYKETKKEEEKIAAAKPPAAPISINPLKTVQTYGQAQPQQGSEIEQQRIIDSMRRSVETPQIPEYDYNLSMPTRPSSSNIQSERDITGRSTTGAGLQKKITPYDQEQAALRRMMQRGY